MSFNSNEGENLFFCEMLFFFLVTCPFRWYIGIYIHFLSLITVLLKYSSHTMAFTLLKCTAQWFFNIHRVVQPSLLPNSRNFYHQKRNPISIISHSHCPPFRTSKPLSTTNVLCLFLLPVLDVSSK